MSWVFTKKEGEKCEEYCFNIWNVLRQTIQKSFFYKECAFKIEEKYKGQCNSMRS